MQTHLYLRHVLGWAKKTVIELGKTDIDCLIRKSFWDINWGPEKPAGMANGRAERVSVKCLRR